MSKQPNRQPNRLIEEKSPYLLQHAHNPVDWHSWGEEAFRQAREQDRPIFLSIGYSTCHWCHVMERESFEDAETAAMMNRCFVNIKVDREERPDVDRVYMSYVQASTGSGGWPMSVWLTPDLNPFYGGTYFPPEDRFGRPGFRSVLEKIFGLWQQQRDVVVRSSENITAQMRAAVAVFGRQLVDSTVLYRAFKIFQQSYDHRHGGFGQAPKFPRPVTHNFLLRYFARTGDEEAARMVLATLGAMANGGMYDHLGGGFHRYSVDGFWHVPHFEKMLYDQAQLVASCLEGYQISRDEFFARTARETIEYVLRDLTDPASGAFYSAEDADSLLEAGRHERAEGAFYVWTQAEIEQLLGADAELFHSRYGIKPQGNAEDPHGELAGKNVLHVMRSMEQVAAAFGRKPEEVAEALEGACQKLRASRERRPRPHLDDKVLCAWNGLMISALARAYQVLGDEPGASRYLDAARRAARFLASTLWNEREATLYRRYRDGQVAFQGYLEDYASLVQALLDLYEASLELEWLRLASRLTERMTELFWDADGGGFFATSGRDPSVLLRLKDDYDGAEPSGNSIAALNLLRLASMLDRTEWRQKAELTLQAFSGRLTEAPHALPQMLVAFAFLQDEPTQIVVAGERDDPHTQALLRVVHERFLPNKVLLLADATARAELGPTLPFLAGMIPRNGRSTAYVCRHYSCEQPVEEPAALRELLGAAPGPPGGLHPVSWTSNPGAV